jgi:hypothetical protein
MLKLKVLGSTPCPQPWEAMRGNQRARHCEACNKNVHNFAAMSARQVEQLVRENEGHLCARVTYRSDGSIRTLDDPTQPSVAAGLVLASSLAFALPVAAKTSSSAPDAETATLTGTVLQADGSQPFVGAAIGLRSGDSVVAIVHSDQQGRFVVSAPPGQYEISIGRTPFFGAHIYAADLHVGEQSLQPFSLTSTTYTETVMGGDIVATYRYPISYLFKHPIRYLKHLPHNF